MPRRRVAMGKNPRAYFADFDTDPAYPEVKHINRAPHADIPAITYAQARNEIIEHLRNQISGLRAQIAYVSKLGPKDAPANGELDED